MALWKVTTCDNTTSPQDGIYTITNIRSNLNWISDDVQASIDTPTTPMTTVEEEENKARNIIKNKVCRNPVSAASENYKLKMATFDNGQPEKFLVLTRNSNIEINGTGTITVAGQINYLHMMLPGDYLWEFDKLASHNNLTMNSHLKHIQEGLLWYFYRLTTYPRRIAQCDDQCVSIGTFILRYLPHAWRILTTTYQVSMYQEYPIRCTQKN